MATEIDALLQEIVGMKSYVEDKVTNGVEPLKEEQHRMAGILENVETAMKELRRERLNHSNPGGQFRVPTGRVAGFDSLDLKILSTIMEGREARGIQMSGGMRDMLAGSKKDLSDSVTVDKLMAWEEDAIKRRDIMHPGVAGAQNFRSAAAGWRAGMMEAHGKALDSTTSGSGDELVPTIEAATLWMTSTWTPLFSQCCNKFLCQATHSTSRLSSATRTGIQSAKMFSRSQLTLQPLK